MYPNTILKIILNILIVISIKLLILYEKIHFNKYIDSWDSVWRYDDVEIRLYMLPYIDFLNITSYWNINILYLQIQKYIRIKKIKNKINKNLLIKPILHELKNLKPDKNINVFKDGTMFYKNSKQQFNNIPPHLIFPGELELLKDFLIKEKADGELVNNPTK